MLASEEEVADGGRFLVADRREVSEVVRRVAALRERVLRPGLEVDEDVASQVAGRGLVGARVDLVEVGEERRGVRLDLRGIERGAARAAREVGEDAPRRRRVDRVGLPVRLVVRHVRVRRAVASLRDPGARGEADHHLGVRSQLELVDGAELRSGQVQARVERHVTEHRERDRDDDGIVLDRPGRRALEEGELDATVAELGDLPEHAAVLDLAGQAIGEAHGDLLVAADDVVALVREHAPGREFRASVGVDEEEEREAGELVGVEAVFDRVRDVDDRADDRRRVPRAEVLAEAHPV